MKIFALSAMLWFCLFGGTMALETPLPQWERQGIAYRTVRVIDGDTLAIDLNGDGHLQKPAEHIRLWFVDTPELVESPKGKNPKFGMPAQHFLERLLPDPHSALWFDPQHRWDQHERPLAILEVRERNINLELIRAGHSYFDTRFGFPRDYPAYAQAEREAFEQSRGIWSTPESREHYLQRLQAEGKTVRSKKNPLWVAPLQPAQTLKLPDYADHYLSLQGRIQTMTRDEHGGAVLRLTNLYLPQGLPVYVPPQRWKQLVLESLQVGDSFSGEGFVKQWKGEHWELQLHWAQVSSSRFLGTGTPETPESSRSAFPAGRFPSPGIPEAPPPALEKAESP